MTAHAEIIVGAPDRDAPRAFRPTMNGEGRLRGFPRELGEDAVAPFGSDAVKMHPECRLVIESRARSHQARLRKLSPDHPSDERGACDKGTTRQWIVTDEGFSSVGEINPQHYKVVVGLFRQMRTICRGQTTNRRASGTALERIVSPAAPSLIEGEKLSAQAPVLTGRRRKLGT